MPEIRYPEVQNGPYTAAAVVTPNDGANLTPPNAGLPAACRALVIGVGGTVTVDMANGGTGIQMTLAAGIYALTVTKVYATGTAATGIVALW